MDGAAMKPATDPETETLRRRIAVLEAENQAWRAAIDAASAGDPQATQRALLEEKRTLEVLNRTGAALAAELDLNRLVQIVTDAGVQLIGAAFGAFFYNTTDERGEQFLLYTLSGAPREAFASFPTPGRTEIFGPTFDGTAIVRSDDITKDPRYGKGERYRGMPPGHLPVRSYLAVPVVSPKREPLGGLFFGHPEPGVFNERSERVIVGIAAQAAIAVENAHLLQAVTYSEHRFRALIERNTDGIAVIDAENKILYLSPSVLAIEGYTQDELIGVNGMDNTHPDDIPHVHDIVRRALENPGVPVPALWRRRHKDGRWLWLEGVATNLLHDPAVRGIVTNYRDVTQRVRSQEAQIRSQKMEALGTLAGGIAHDFNNILLAIRGNVRLAREDLEPGHPGELSITEIEKAAQRATELVRRILAFSRPQESQREPLQLSIVVQEALNLMRATLPAMIAIRTRFAGDTPLVFADSTQVHQVVMNIVTNAAHAIGNRTGDIEVRIDPINVTAELGDSARELKPGLYACVAISDTGSGIEQATLKRIFDPFFTTKPVGQGTGLGLSVAHGIMQAHEGTISVYTQSGKGTTFRLYFPAASEQRTADPTAAVPSVAGRGENVLYIDDDDAIVLLTTRVLERLGYRVSGFTHPQQALDAFTARSREFDVVVTDLSMPGMSGFDLVEALRRVRADIPILMTSGYVRPEDRQRASEHGLGDVILKPNTVDELGQALHGMFTQLRASRS
jgi:PAS domain S-box-containing protein